MKRFYIQNIYYLLDISGFQIKWIKSMQKSKSQVQRRLRDYLLRFLRCLLLYLHFLWQCLPLYNTEYNSQSDDLSVHIFQQKQTLPKLAFHKFVSHFFSS